jgi:Tfp pilus assembly PilM family ATPase
MSVLSALSNVQGPTAALEIAATQVTGARLEQRRGQASLSAHAVAALPPGALVPSLTGANVVDRAVVAAAVGRVLEQIGRPGRIALVIPDLVAKVSVLKFEQVPPRATDLEQLVRWQVRKTAPFPIDEAQVSYVPGQRSSDGQEFLVSLARRDVVAEYERLASDAGAYPGIVDLATLNVINAALATSAAGATGDWLLVNLAPDYATLAVIRGRDVVLFRSRAADAESSLVDLVHQTTMYYEDRLHGSGFTRVILAGVPHASDVERARRSLQERLTTQVDSLDLRSLVTLTDRITGTAAVLESLAPLVGVLLRGREAA